MSVINLYDFISLFGKDATPEKGKRILKTDKLPEFPNKIEGEKYIAFKDFEGYYSTQEEEKFQEPFQVPFLNLNDQNIKYDVLDVDLACFDIEDIGPTLEAVYERQTILKEHPELGIDSRFFIILDDVMSDKYKIRFSKQLSKAFTDGRHYGIFTLITCQDPFGIGPDLRENADVVIVFRQNQQSRKEAISLNFMDAIIDKKVRPQFLWDHTRKIDPESGEILDYEELPEGEDDQKLEEKGIPCALVINQAKSTENFNQVFKFAIASEVDDFIMGSPEFWKAQKTGDWSKTKKKNK